MENIYDAPKAELIEQPNSEFGPPFFVTSISKMCVLYMLTASMYLVYWAYKHWDSQRFAMGKKISPVMRSVFMIFFTHSLSKRISQRLQAQGSPHRYSSTAPTLFVVFTLIGTVFSVLGDKAGASPLTVAVLAVVCLILQLLPMVAIQRSANLASEDPTGERNSTLSGWNWLFIVLGVGYWLLMIAGFVLIGLGLDKA